MSERGQPYVTVAPKRSYEKVPVSFDAHDFLVRLRAPATAYALDTLVRPLRALATGLQYRCTTAGVSGAREPSWPKVAAGTVTDGTVVWTAEAITTGSLRSTVSTSTFPAVTGVTITDAGVSDLIYVALVDGGTSGQRYEITHRLLLANGEKREAVAVLPVQD